ncbi:MAG: hypothetical protein NVSMB46_03510 [Candidatus Saccharimonadales bacterium]
MSERDLDHNLDNEPVTDDYYPPVDYENPFANAVLDIVKMGTLREVLGAERADPILAAMEAQDARMANLIAKHFKGSLGPEKRREDC